MESIDPRHLLVKIAEILERLGIPYAVTGGIAVFIWGKPRFTADIDIITLIQVNDIEGLVKELRKLSEYSYVDEGAIRDAFLRNGEFNFIDGTSGIKVDFWILKRGGFSKIQIERRIPRVVLGKKVYFVSPEDLILNKLIWYKEGESVKQKEDVKTILKFQKKLDRNYLRKWAKIHSTFQILEKLWKESEK